MSLRSSLYLTVIGFALCWLLWVFAPLSFYGEKEIHPDNAPGDIWRKQISFHHSPWQTGLLRLSSKGCLLSVAVNGTNIPVTPPWSGSPCLQKSIIVDAAPLIESGDNEVEITYSMGNVIGETARIRSVPSGFTILAMTICIFLAPIVRGLNGLRAMEWLPFIRHYRRHGLIAVSGLSAAAYIRMHLLYFVSADYTIFLNPWVNYIRQHGMHAYGVAFTNYSPLYTYFLGIGDLFFPALSPLRLVKYITFAGEAYAAFWVYRIIALTCAPYSLRPMVAAMLLLLCPSVIINGGGSGQCDIWYAAFLLAGLYYILLRRPNLAMVYAGFALAFKLQAVFLSPLLLILVLRKKIPWPSLIIVPCIYLLTCVPAWLEGRPIYELISIYWTKFSSDHISSNAANLYTYLHKYNTQYVIDLGLLCSVELAGLMVYVLYKRWKTEPDVESLLLLGALFAAIMPFVLPKMHDRYFFAADVLSLMLACLRPRWAIIPVLLQSASMIAVPPRQFMNVGGIIGWIQGQRIYTAIGLNALAIILLLVLTRKYICKAGCFSNAPPTDTSLAASTSS